MRRKTSLLVHFFSNEQAPHCKRSQRAMMCALKLCDLKRTLLLLLIAGLVGWCQGQAGGKEPANYVTYLVTEGNKSLPVCQGQMMSKPDGLVQGFQSGSSLTVNQSGVYICKSGSATTVYYVHMEVTDPVRSCGLMLPLKKQDRSHNLMEASTLTVPCRAFGQGVSLALESTRDCQLKTPNVEYKAGVGFEVKNVQTDFSGPWQCVARKTGEGEGRGCEQIELFNVTVTSKSKAQGGNKSGSNSGPLIAGIVVLLLLLVVCIPFLVWRLRRKRQLTQLSKNDVRVFLEGAVDTINPEMGLDQQADLLPYNALYEFPRENLKLGRQLGSGAYGRVVKADAVGFLYGADTTVEDGGEKMKNTTIVAVKMIKPHAEVAHLKALMTELKILIHMGKHLNVVNLLGACTTGLSKKELLVIVEYCRFGNLHSYLLRQRDDFLDQVNHEKDTMDFTIGVIESGIPDPVPDDDGAPMSDTESTGYQNLPKDQRQVLSFNSDTKTVTYDPEPQSTSQGGSEVYRVVSENSAGSSGHCGHKYRGDFNPAEAQRVSTKDLVCWSYQVARGMEYLSNRKIVHADLAARNLLLAENNVVKICDFGLARNLYQDANYLKKSDDPLPLRWMAIESIRDRVFSTQSDVWSFGVVLWEFFTLAMTPFPGISLDDSFLPRLLDGYRMEKPQYCTNMMYHVMRSCWEERANKRPTFTNLVAEFGQILDDNVKQLYLELNGPYMRMNSAQQDYLKMSRASRNYVLPTGHKTESVQLSIANNYQIPGAPVKVAKDVEGNIHGGNEYKQAPTDKTLGYVNLSRAEPAAAEVYVPQVESLAVEAPPDGYLRMSPTLQN